MERRDLPAATIIEQGKQIGPAEVRPGQVILTGTKREADIIKDALQTLLYSKVRLGEDIGQDDVEAVERLIAEIGTPRYVDESGLST